MYAPNPNRPTIPTSRRDQFASVGLETASRGKILTLCFDRIDRDLVEARDAIGTGDHFATNVALGHAQELLGELAMMLDPAAWEHAGSLLAVYDYVLRLLMQANTLKSDALVAEAQGLVTEIGDAFRTAATSEPESSSPTPGTDDAENPPTAPRERFSVQA